MSATRDHPLGPSPRDGRTPLQPSRTLVAFGDSIANGLGSKGQSYPALVAEHFDARYVELTGTGATIDNALQFQERALDAGIVLIAFGTTEAIVRPTPAALRLMQPRWRRAGWMDPRPYYSRRWWKRLFQRIDSAIRWRVKVALIRLTGGARWMSPDAYERKLATLINYLQEGGVQTIVIVSQLDHDDRFFPTSAASISEYRTINERAADARGVIFCDASAVCRRWSDFLSDHFHPNQSGHRRVARQIIECLETAVGVGDNLRVTVRRQHGPLR